ncbi:MAG: hypothetical protein ACM3XP_00470 [Nitrososphaerales archaeon]
MRRKSTNALTEHINSLLRIDPLAVRAYDKTCASVLLSVLLYQIVVYYNYKPEKIIPEQSNTCYGHNYRLDSIVSI